MTLYEIDAAILDCIDTETGEVVDAEKLTALQMERDAKCEAVALWIKDLDAQAAAIKTEKQALAERQAATERKADSLRRWLQDALGGQKFQTARCAVTYRKTQRVEIPDIYKLDENYLRYATPTADKAAIKAAIKAGETVAGAELIEGVSMSIK